MIPSVSIRIRRFNPGRLHPSPDWTRSTCRLWPIARTISSGVFDGNSGNDTLIGSDGRDRLDGGIGSDTLFGFGGDDRLWGDGGGGSTNDHDVLFAGQGNDDLIGGQGTNELYAWSFDPQPAMIPPGSSETIPTTASESSSMRMAICSTTMAT